MISDGTVLRAEYTLSAVEYKMKDPDRDMNKLGNLPDLDTACLRVRDTVCLRVCVCVRVSERERWIKRRERQI